jgi:glyoxylase-like metal-dependent hydrolase (beta-lactamase superfamily II)
MSSSKAFASQADLGEKRITFEQLSEHCWAYTAEGDPNSGVIIGSDCCMVLDTTATPVMARDLIKRIRSVTSKPIKYVFLTHYHAVRVLGASAYAAEGATEIISSAATREMIVERGAQDMQSEIERFPRLFAGVDSIPGLTWPTMTFEREMTLYLGTLEIKLMHLGAGHTRGDAIAWVPSEKVLYSGDLVEMEAGVYTGDAQLQEWPATLQALRTLGAEKLMPGRGEAMKTPADVNRALDYTARWVSMLYEAAQEGVRNKLTLKQTFELTKQRMDPVFGHVPIYEHCMPFDVSRAVDEASGIKHPRIWTAERDQEMWAALQS